MRRVCRFARVPVAHPLASVASRNRMVGGSAGPSGATARGGAGTVAGAGTGASAAREAGTAGAGAPGVHSLRQGRARDATRASVAGQPIRRREISGIALLWPSVALGCW